MLIWKIFKNILAHLTNSGKNEGPTIKKTFICKGCMWLHEITPPPLVNPFNRNKYSCLYPQLPQFQSISLKIADDCHTPFTCPFLLKKMREEKLNEING